MTERENQTRLSEIRARLSAATPGPWEFGDRYSIAGVMPKMFGAGRCSSCGHGELVWQGRRDINGTVMPAHVHAADSPWPHGIVHYEGDGWVARVVNDTDEYGYMIDEDATFIANAPSDIEWLLGEVERLEKL